MVFVFEKGWKYSVKKRKNWNQKSFYLTHYHILMHSRYIAVENIVWKGEIAYDKQFFLFSQCFYPI